jgi:hypothetical protein
MQGVTSRLHCSYPVSFALLSCLSCSSRNDTYMTLASILQGNYGPLALQGRFWLNRPTRRCGRRKLVHSGGKAVAVGGWGANGGIGVGSNGAGTRAHGAPPNPHLTPPRPLRYGMGSPRPPLTLDRPAARTRFRWRFAVWSSPTGAADRARDPPRPSRSRLCIRLREGTAR